MKLSELPEGASFRLRAATTVYEKRETVAGVHPNGSADLTTCHFPYPSAPFKRGEITVNPHRLDVELPTTP
jgi:hypothetical protein